MMLFYSLGLALALVISSPWWLVQMLVSGRYREGLAERLGRVPARLQAKPGCIWLHAVSVGEVLAASRLVSELEGAGHSVVISTTTRAGQQLARSRFGSERVFYFPLDFAFAVRAYLRTLRPSLLVLMESELWPRVLVECERAGVPVMVANARVSDRSFPRYMHLRGLWKPLLAKVHLLLAQSHEDAQRWKQIGAARVETSGNLKYEVQPPKESQIVDLIRKNTNDAILVCGSTLEGEERMLMDCWRTHHPAGVLVLAPRHPQRFASVAALIAEYGFRMAKLSEWREAPSPLQTGDVLLVDTIGDLAALYSIGWGAFVGGSLVDAGGHNPLEPALYGVSVAIGPSYQNFREIVEKMIAANAIRIVTPESLCAAMGDMLGSPDVKMGERGRAFYESQSGATLKTLRAIEAILKGEQYA
ncbi:MAG: 3-deoxy-D-manno-octulosonic acid transferase [Acidobacteria bacterium]|nr:3-deoxy-D-manno-octulosonic acid transferase [Acidobacteriota bacterium]